MFKSLIIVFALIFWAPVHARSEAPLAIQVDEQSDNPIREQVFRICAKLFSRDSAKLVGRIGGRLLETILGVSHPKHHPDMHRAFRYVMLVPLLIEQGLRMLNFIPLVEPNFFAKVRRERDQAKPIQQSYSWSDWRRAGFWKQGVRKSLKVISPIVYPRWLIRWVTLATVISLAAPVESATFQKLTQSVRVSDRLGHVALLFDPWDFDGSRERPNPHVSLLVRGPVTDHVFDFGPQTIQTRRALFHFLYLPSEPGSREPAKGRKDGDTLTSVELKLSPEQIVKLLKQLREAEWMRYDHQGPAQNCTTIALEFLRRVEPGINVPAGINGSPNLTLLWLQSLKFLRPDLVGRLAWVSLGKPETPEASLPRFGGAVLEAKFFVAGAFGFLLAQGSQEEVQLLGVSPIVAKAIADGKVEMIDELMGRNDVENYMLNSALALASFASDSTKRTEFVDLLRPQFDELIAKLNEELRVTRESFEPKNTDQSEFYRLEAKVPALEAVVEAVRKQFQAVVGNQ